jgi:DNA repair protein RecO
MKVTQHPTLDLAIVLRSVPYEERHRVVTALTEGHGLITALARNSIQSRRFGGTLDLFTASEWMFTLKPGAELYSLTEAKIREGFESIRKSFERLSLASVLSEIMIKLAPQNEACPEYFRLHSNALSTLSTSNEVGKEVVLLNSYLAKLLQLSGSQPRLQSCIQCEISLEKVDPHRALSCVIADAGWICSECRVQDTRHIRERDGRTLQHSMLRLSPLSIKDFQLSLRLPIRQITAHALASPQEHKDLFKFLEALYVFHIPGFDKKPLKSLRFLDLESTVKN